MLIGMSRPSSTDAGAGAALVALIGLALSCGCSVAGASVDPEGAAMGVVRVNGVTLALRSQLFDGEPAEIADRLAQRWGARLDSPRGTGGARGGGPVPYRLGRQRGSFHETLSLSAGPRAGTSIALIAVQDLRRAPRAPAAVPFRLPTAMRVLSVVEFGSGLAAPRSYALDGTAAPEQALSAVVAAARTAGWQPLARPAPAAGAAAAWMRRGGDEMTATAVRSGAHCRVILLVTTAEGRHR